MILLTVGMKHEKVPFMAVLSVRPPHFRRLCRQLASISCAEYKDPPVFLPTTDDLPPKTQSLSCPVNMFQLNSQLKQLTKSGDLRNARNMFDEMPHRDEISWTTLISGYVSDLNSTDALVLFSKMWVEPGLVMDPFILSLALKACGHNLNANFGESLHGYSVKTNFVDSVFVGSALLDMYMKIGKTEEGCKVFDEMPLRNVVSWTAIITGLVRDGRNVDALAYLSEMWRSKVVCDSYTFAIALKACADSGALNCGREIHCQSMKRGLDENSFVVNTLATMYFKCGKLLYGSCLLEKIETKNVVSWTTFITMYIQTGREENALKAFMKMQEAGVTPNEFTYAAVLSGCANIGRIEWGKQIHAHILRLGLADSLSVANSIMTMYTKCGQITCASLVFEGLTRRDIVSWSTIIAGCSQEGCGEEAMEYLSRMMREGPRPTEFAFSSVLSVCGNMAILDQGKQLHAHVLCVGLEQTALVQSALINMYSKCGSIKEASKIFEEGNNDDIVSWTAMINGYAEHGYSKEAIDLFEKIPKAGLRPDSVTFIGVLSVCSHAGLVDLGYYYFNLMSKDYGIFPSKQHYGCMIDLLCRAGRLSEANRMIENMPFEKDDVIWSTLLRAGRDHGDIDCARLAAEKILELDPNCAGTHITLANLYAAKGRWKEVADLRKMMKSKGVIKDPGWSWIKVTDQVTAFVSRDHSHAKHEDIYNILDLIVFREDMAIKDMESLLNYNED